MALTLVTAMYLADRQAESICRQCVQKYDCAGIADMMGIFISHWSPCSITPLSKMLCKSQDMTAGRHISQAGGNGDCVATETVWQHSSAAFHDSWYICLVKKQPQMFPEFTLPFQHHQGQF